MSASETVVVKHRRPTPEVIVVKRKQTTATLVGRFLGVLIVAPLITGLCLMLLLPLAHEVLGTPDLHPGYWQCVALSFLLRAVVGGIARSTQQPDYTS
jgi:hypothetical protein